MMTRRAATKAAGLSAIAYTRVLGANDRIGLGVIGTGGRGQFVMSLFQKNAEVDVRAVCDVYAKRLDEAQGKAPGAKGFVDHRELLQLKEVDAVLIGSPDHWHKDHAIDAMNAGKDVYVEKPMCRTRDEAPMMVRAARANNRVCQVGVQQRSGPTYLESRDRYVRTGEIGKVTHIDAIWHGGAARPVRSEPELVEKPGNLDWIRFLGPVAYRDWVPGQYLNFRAYLDFNGGKLTDFGHHWMDTVHMFKGERACNSAVFAGGVFFDFKDGRTAPDTCNALFEYDGFTVAFASNAYETGQEYGVTFYGENGRLFVNRNRYEYVPRGRGATPVHMRIEGDITAQHVRNFLDCCKSRQRPNGDAAIAAVSIVPPLLAVESYLTRKRMRFDPDRMEVIPG